MPDLLTTTIHITYQNATHSAATIQQYIFSPNEEVWRRMRRRRVILSGAVARVPGAAPHPGATRIAGVIPPGRTTSSARKKHGIIILYSIGVMFCPMWATLVATGNTMTLVP